jgi:hypothetical protein
MSVGLYAPPSDSAIVYTLAVFWNGKTWSRLKSLNP